MKIKVVESTTLLESAKAMLKEIDNSDMSVEHFIIVPDRYSLQTEKILFSVTGKECFFNINVVGVSSFAIKMLDKYGIDFEPTNSSESLLITDMAMSNVSNQMTCLKKNNINFVNEISKAIGQFKSCNIMPEELVNSCALISGKNKFNDLSLIYEEYEKLSQNTMDANKLLIKLRETLKSKKENIKVYFAFFDSFTEQVYQLMQVLAETCLEVQVAYCQGTSLGNQYIYEDDILQKISNLSKEKGFTVEVKKVVPQFNNSQSVIAENLFSANSVKAKNEKYFSLINSPTKYSQILAISKVIRYMVQNGSKYNEFLLACGNSEKYFPLIENIFEEMEIPCFIDQSITADKTLLSCVLFKFFDVVLSGYAKENAQGLISNRLLQIEDKESLISKIETFGISGKNSFKKYLAQFVPEIDKLLNKIETETSVESLCECVEQILQMTEKSFDNYMQYAEEQGFLKEKNINTQIKDVVLESLETIKKYRHGNIELKEFVNLLKLILSYKEVLSIPAYLDAVFVGSVEESSFEEKKYVFVIGGEALPKFTGDNGLITDDDIAFSKLKNRLSPTIRMINRRNRFKLFSVLTLAQEKLFVGYTTSNDDGKKNERPAFIENLISLFGENEFSSSILDNLNDFSKENRFLLSVGNKNEAIRFLAQNYNKNLFNGKRLECLKNLLKLDLKKFELKREVFEGDRQKLFFPKNYTKVSQLECYFSCPFKHFVRYGLKINEYQLPEFDQRDIGNVCHKMAELFVKEKKYISGKPKEFVENNFYKVLSQENLIEKFEASQEKEALEKFIKKQSEKILSSISYELTQSEFVPLYVEKQLEGLTLQNGKERMNVVGKVDRIDACQDCFRIIDYKTGKVGPIIKDLYYGDKLQLFVYQNAVSKMINKKSAGALYFDCKWDYSQQGEDKSILKGVVSNEEDVIARYDKFLENKGKSDIVAIALSSAKKKKSLYKGSAIAKCSLEKFEQYALKVCEKAIEEIQQGYIQPKPDDNSCGACKYRGICLQSLSSGVRKKSKISQDNIIEALGGKDDKAD